MENKKFRLKNLISADEIKSKLPASGGLGFLFHSTGWKTLSYAFENVKSHTAEFAKELWNTPPFIASEIKLNNEFIGANIAMPVPLCLWMGSPRGIREFRQKQLFPALKLANDCNIKIVAMGASTPYACNYGKLERPLKTPFITTGHGATVATLRKLAIEACRYSGCVYENISLAIFGASGSLGRALVNYITQIDPPAEIILIDLNDKKSLLKNQAEEIAQKTKRKDLKISTYCFGSSSPLPKFDGAILVSNNSTPYLGVEDLKKAKFWIDDSHPRAASVEAETLSRNKTLYVECYIRGPEGFDTTFPFQLPSGRDCYTCCAEGYVAWQEGIDHDFVTGIPDTKQIALIDKLLNKYNFNIGPFFGKNGEVIIKP